MKSKKNDRFTEVAFYVCRLLMFVIFVIGIPAMPVFADAEKKPVKPPKPIEKTVPKEKKNPEMVMTAEEILNLATETKLNANGLLDYTKVILLCEKAESKGLSEENMEFCRQLRISTQVQRGLIIAQYFMQDELSLEKLPLDWIKFRKMALEDLEAGQKDSQDNATIQLAIGRLYLLPQGNSEKAKKALDLAIKAASDDSVLLSKALKYRAELEKNPKKILALLEQAIKFQPEDGQILSQIADQWLKAKDYQKALLFIDKALKITPNSKEYKRVKAFVLAGLDKKSEAEKLYNETISGKDRLLDQVERADFLAQLGKKEEALKIFSEMANRYKSPGLYFLRASIYAQEKQYEKALNDLNLALGNDPNFSDAIRLKAFVYLEMENYPEAIRNFELLLKNSPDDPQKVSHLAYAWAKSGDLGKALKILDEGLKKAKDNIDLLRNRADINLMYGKWNEAIADYNSILKLDPEDSGVLNNFSWLLATSPEASVRNGKKALEYGLKACELTWYKEAHILSTLAAAYAELGQFDKARDWSSKSILLGEKDKMPRIEDLRNELKSYKENKPWREIPEKLRIGAGKDNSKNEMKKDTPKAEVKKDAPMAEVKKDAPKAEIKKDAPKVEVKKDAPKAEIKK